MPLCLFLVLCILILSIKIVEEFKKEKRVEKKEITGKIYIPEIPKRIEKRKIEKRGKVAIIIDDVGWNLSIIKEIEEINRPLTLSILPKAPYSKKILNELKDKNYELLLHLPLEPMPPSQCLDKGLIKVDMSEEEIKSVFEDDIKDFLPYVKGVNNHMGSLYTINEEKMRVLLENIKENNLFFVDSLTNSKSCGYKIAKEIGVKTGKRDIFIDVSPDPDEINKKIDEILKLAKEKGEVIAIGHAKSQTISILKRRINEFDENGIEIVPVSELLQ